MGISADDANDRVEQLLALTERLTDILRLDLRAFENRRPQEAAARAEEHGRLANLYRHESARVKRDPRLIAAAPEARRKQLIAATQVLEETLQQHARALAAAKAVTEGLVRTIAEEVASQKTATAGYGPRGGAAAASLGPMALNRKA